MFAWATIIALVLGVIFYVADPFTVMMNVAELAGVVALFMLVCAAEAYSSSRG
jgi:hypothetical protein